MPVYPTHTPHILDPVSLDDVQKLQIVQGHRTLTHEHLDHIPDEVRTFDDWLQFLSKTKEDDITAICPFIGLSWPKIFAVSFGEIPRPLCFRCLPLCESIAWSTRGRTRSANRR